jgi:hypothetical protein
MVAGGAVSDPRSMRTSDAAAGAALISATPVVAWWVVGDLSEDVDPQNADYMVRPPPLSPAGQHAIGIVASVVVAAALGVLVTASVRRRIEPRWWGFALPLVALGICAGVSYRIVTAAVIGANIGGGMVVMTAPIVAVAALRLSARSWQRLPARGQH